MPIKQLSPTNAAYLAGIIDADGTITLTRKHINENRHAAVTISNCDHPLLEFSKAAIGTGKITSKRCTKAHHTPCYTYAIYNRQALLLLEQLSPFLRTYKKQRADMILKNYIRLTPRNGHYTAELKAERLVFEENVLTLKPQFDL